MKLTDRLYEAAKPIWDGYLKQPFVKELGEGTLSMERFRFYMIQDYRYLLQYAKVFALGIVKAEEEELQRLFAGMVHDTLDGEMKVHKAYMARLGITDEEVTNTKTALCNQSYTSYMLRIAYEEGETEILTAILSCALSYEYIAKNIVTFIIKNNKFPIFYKTTVNNTLNSNISNMILFNRVS